jgi:mannose-6-phosphate isomerase
VARERPASDPAFRWVADLCERHPADVGALAPLLLNVVTLAPGEAMYLPAGELHSYLGGVAIEVMASSDNVLRGGLTAKHVDVPELLRTLTFESGPVDVLRARPGAPGEGRFETPAEEFRLARIEVDAPRAFEAAAVRGVEIWICIDGAGRLTSADQTLELRRGESLLVPAAVPAYRVEGRGVFYRAAAGGEPDPPADSLPAS